MIRNIDDMTVEHIDAHKDGSGTITVTNFFEHEDFLGKGRFYGITEIKPGDHIGKHQHVGDQEAYFILEGEADYLDNDVWRRVKPGDLTICRDGGWHSIRSVGDKPLRYIALIIYN